MRKLGYTDVRERHRPHDVVVPLDCDESGDVECDGHLRQLALGIPEAVHHLPSMEPPCILSYTLEGRAMPWQRVDRIVHVEDLDAAERIASRAAFGDESLSPIDYLEPYDSQVLVTAERGQAARSIELYQHAGTLRRRQNAFRWCWEKFAQSKDFRFSSRHYWIEHSLCWDGRTGRGYGTPARGRLLDFLTTVHEPRLQVVAAYGLGRIGR